MGGLSDHHAGGAQPDRPARSAARASIGRAPERDPHSGEHRTHLIFGYASLVLDGAGRGVPARLPGYRRVWGVATDNVHSIPGYKMYLRRPEGTRPAVYVAFVDLEPHDGSVVNGLVRPVSAGELEDLDRRERNYDRVEVTGQIEGFDERVFTYLGSAAGRERLRRGRVEGRAVVSRDYLAKVLAGFDRLGVDERRAFDDSSLLGGLPVLDLERVDLPGDPPRLESGV